MSLRSISLHCRSMITAWSNLKGILLYFILECDPLLAIGDIICSMSLHGLRPHNWSRCRLFLNLCDSLRHSFVDLFPQLHQNNVVHVHLIRSLDVSIFVRLIIMEKIVFIVNCLNVKLRLTLAATFNLFHLAFLLLLWLLFYSSFKHLSVHYAAVIIFGLGQEMTWYLLLNCQRNGMPESEYRALVTLRLDLDVSS